MKNNRLFGIIYILLSKKMITAKELADYFEVSTRTIYRDVETLSLLDIPIYMSKGKNGGINLLENYKFDKTLLTDDEQKSILFSLQEISGLNINDNNLYEKLKTVFNKENEEWFNIDFGIWGNSTTHKENFELIKKAILEKNIIEFTYFSTSGTKSIKKVEPLKLCFKYNSWYLYAFDTYKKEDRLYKIMRIKNIKNTNEFFESNNRILKENIYDDPKDIIHLELEIDKSLTYRVYGEFDESCISILPNGNYLIDTNLPENEWLYGYLLSFGDKLRIMSPSHIKNIVIDKMKKSIENYM